MKKKIITLIIFVILLISIITTHSINNLINFTIGNTLLYMNGSQDGVVDEDWFNDWEYTLDDNYIYLVSIKEGINATKYTIPSKAKIDGSEYTTKINNGGILANSPVEELKLESGIIIQLNTSLLSGSNVIKLDMSNMDLSYLNDMSFLNGKELDTLDVSGSDLSNLTSFNFSGIFPNATRIDFSNTTFKKLSNLYLGGGKAKYVDFSNSTIENYSFSNKIFNSGTYENVSFKGANLSGITSTGVYFLSDTCITNLDFSDVKLPNATSLSSNFSHSYCLETIDLSNLDAPLLKYMNSTFSDDPNLKEVKFDGFKSEIQGSNSSYMFNNCTSLKKISIEGFQSLRYFVTPTMEEITVKDVDTIEEYFSYDCSKFNGEPCKLKKLNLININKIEDKSFANTNDLNEINFSGSTPELGKYAFYYKPSEYLPTWTDFSDVDHQSPYDSKYMPIRKITKVTYDDSNILKYDWLKDNRYVSDFKTHKLTYNYNYEGSEDVVTTFTAGDRVVNSIPTRNEYTFKGWNTKQNGTGELYTPDEVIYLNSDLTLYAQWKKRTYDYNSNNSGWLGENVKWRIEDDTTYIYPVGDSDGRTYDQVDVDDSSITMPREICSTDNIVFEEGITYIGKYFLKGCNSKKNVTFPSTLEEIGEGAFLINIENVIGLDFSTVKFQREVFYNNTYYEPMNSGNVYWWVSHPKEHTITIDANGGSFSDGTTSKEYTGILGYIEYYYNSSIRSYESRQKNPIDIEIPTKDGYVFKYFNTSIDGTGNTVKVDDDKILLEVPTSIKLYAIYGKEKYKVVFETGDIPFSITEQELYYGERLTSEIPEKEGYIFAEWNTKEDGSGIGYYPDQIMTQQKDLKLYPIFRKPVELIEEEGYSYSGSAKVAKLSDGSTVRVFRINHDYAYENEGTYYEVSKEYLTQIKQYKGFEFTDDVYDELITLIATFYEDNEGGMFDTLNTPDNFYSVYHDMVKQLSERILSPRQHTSNNGYEKYMHELRFRFIFEHSDEIGKKYKLRLFTNGSYVYAGLEPIEDNDNSNENNHSSILDLINNPQTKAPLMIVMILISIISLTLFIKRCLKDKYINK